MLNIPRIRKMQMESTLRWDVEEQSSERFVKTRAGKVVGKEALPHIASRYMNWHESYREHLSTCPY